MGRGRLHTSVAAVLVVLGVGTAVAQEPDVPASVSVRPADTDERDPNDGGWFALELAPGETGETTARVTNVRDVPMDVSFYLADLVLHDDGTVEVAEAPYEGVGAWGEPAIPEATIEPRSSILVDIELTVPEGAEPGDHLGVFVAESLEGGETLDYVFRVATRFYVSVPGSVDRDFEIATLDTEATPTIWPRRMDVTAHVRNTGRGRVSPDVTISGREAEGSRTILVGSAEPYRAELSVPWYGGPVAVTVEASTPELTRAHEQRVWVIPWALIAIVLLVLAAVMLLAVRWRWRRAERRELEAELEQLRRGAAAEGRTAGAPPA